MAIKGEIILKNYSSDSPRSAQNKRIRAVVKIANSTKNWEIMKAWKDYLQQALQFPFEAIVDTYYESGPLEGGDKLKVLRVEIIDDQYGVIVACRKGRRRYDHPLAGLEIVDANSENTQYIGDYKMWFVNH